jgi:adenylate kinase
MNVLLIGPPGSGKGTQGQRLAEQLGLRHIAAGDLLRKEVADESEIGQRVAGLLERGELVPDEVIIDLVLPAVRDAVENHNGYLLDGFPRSVDQALLVRAIVKDDDANADHAIYLDAPPEELVRRIMARAAVEGRSDDNETTVKNRLQVFEAETRPLIEYYEGRGVLRRVDATQPAENVTEQILAALDS